MDQDNNINQQLRSGYRSFIFLIEQYSTSEFDDVESAIYFYLSDDINIILTKKGYRQRSF